jgi:hypothetical protein
LTAICNAGQPRQVREEWCDANPFFRQNRELQLGRYSPARTEVLMRIPGLMILAAGAVLAASPVRAQTYDPAFPVCLHVYGPATYYECAYTSLPQCKASASGRSAQCVINPYFASAGVNYPRSPHPRYRHHYYY